MRYGFTSSEPSISPVLRVYLFEFFLCVEHVSFVFWTEKLREDTNNKLVGRTKCFNNSVETENIMD